MSSNEVDWDDLLARIEAMIEHLDECIEAENASIVAEAESGAEWVDRLLLATT